MRYRLETLLGRPLLPSPIFRLLAGVVLCVLLPSGVPAAVSGVRLLRSDGSEAVFELAAPDPVVTALSGGESRYEVDGWGHSGVMGGPELPQTGVELGVPAGREAVLSVRVLSEGVVPGGLPVPVPRVVITPQGEAPPAQEEIRERDPVLYGQVIPGSWARLVDGGSLRRVRVVGVELTPYRWDPALGAVRVARRLEVTVRFVASAEKSRPSEMGEAAPVESGSWDRVYRRSLLNGEAARSWGRKPVGWSAVAREKSRSSGPELRIRVDRTDLYRMSWSMLRAAGWPEQVPVSQLAMVERFYVEGDSANPFHEEPVPLWVRDLDGDGLFDQGDDVHGEDELVFFGLTIWDDPWYQREYGVRHPLPKDRRYGRENVYFLTERAEGGARMAGAGPSFLGRDDLHPDSTYVWREHIEGDGAYMFASSQSPRDDSYNLPAGANAIQSEHFFWVGGGAPTNGDPGAYPVRFRLPGLVAPLSLRLEYHGLVKLDPGAGGPEAHTSFWFVAAPGDTVKDLWPWTVPDRSRAGQVVEGPALAAAPWRAGENLLLLQEPANAFGAALDWLEMSWVRNYAADSSRVAWTTEDLSGAQEFRLTGMNPSADDSLFVFDLTDSVWTAGSGAAGPRWYGVDAARQVSQLTPRQPRTLRVQLDLAGSPRILVVAALSALRRPKAIELVSGTDLTVPEGGEEQLVIVAAPEFVEGLAPLVSQRRAEGWTVRLASVREVCDQFEGGRFWPTAIRSYLRYLFRMRTTAPSALLLVGDGSDDFAHVLSSSAPDFLPTQTVFSSAYADQPELVSSDEWFVDQLNGSGESLDFHPDMAVGRLPVGSAAELAAVVQKILRYGQFSPQDIWRTRGLFVADDAFSNRIGFSGSYTYHGDEELFRNASRQCQKLIVHDAGFSEFAADSFFVGAYMDTVATLQRCCEWDTGHCALNGWRLACISPSLSLPYFRSDGFDCETGPPKLDNQCYGVKVVRPLLRQDLSRGYLFVNYEGHSNAHLMTHEYIFVDYPDIWLPRDPDVLGNTDKPFVFLGFGCHLGEFSAVDEGLPNRGDCLSERLLFQGSGEGSVASIASTAYEWISYNHILNLGLMQAWFLDPPADQGQTRWILGEVFTQGKELMLAAGSGNSNYKGQVASYVLLGDPSMPMAMAPPRLRVELNGNAWTEGNPVTAEAGSDTARIRVALKDEVHLSQVTVRNAGALVPDSLYTLALPDSTAPGADRRMVLVYNPVLHPSAEEYAIEITARDLNGQVNTLRLPVSTQVAFQVLRGGQPRQIHAQDQFAGGDTVQAAVTVPVDLGPERIELRLDGALLEHASKVPHDPRNWELQGTLPGDLSSDQHVLLLRILDSGGHTVEQSVTILGSSVSGELRILRCYAFPSPFTGEVRIFYTLNRAGSGARLTLYTESGRRIVRLDGPAEVNQEDEILWDGRDADGDPVANGVYFYKLEVRSFQGKTVSRIDRLARVR